MKRIKEKAWSYPEAYWSGTGKDLRVYEVPAILLVEAWSHDVVAVCFRNGELLTRPTRQHPNGELNKLGCPNGLRLVERGEMPGFAMYVDAEEGRLLRHLMPAQVDLAGLRLAHLPTALAELPPQYRSLEEETT